MVWLFVFFRGGTALAHPMPGSMVALSVLENAIRGEAKILLIELGNAVSGQRAANINDPFFKAYIIAHIKAVMVVPETCIAVFKAIRPKIRSAALFHLQE